MKNPFKTLIRSFTGLDEISRRFEEIDTVLHRIENELNEAAKNQQALLEVVKKHHEAELNALNRAYIEIGQSVAIGGDLVKNLRDISGQIKLKDQSPVLSKLESHQDRLLELSESIFEKIPSRQEQEVNRDKIIHQVNYTNHNLYAHLKEASVKRESYHHDLMEAIAKNTIPALNPGTSDGQESRESLATPRFLQPIAPKEMLVWIAIPKTASTSLGEILIPKFVERGPGFNSMIKDTTSALGVQTHKVIEEVWLELSEEDREGMTFTGGHIPFGIHKIFNKKTSYITFLRHPLELVQSYFDFFCNMIPVYSAARKSGMTLERAFQERTMPGLFNLQTRMLAGIPELFPDWISKCSSETQPPKWYGPEVCEVPEYALEVAKENLTKLFSFVGISEEYNKSLIILKDRIGFSMPELIGSRKKVGQYEKLLKGERSANRIMDMIMKHNSLDAQLYNFAKSILEQEWRQLGDDKYKEKEVLDYYDSYIASKTDEASMHNAVEEVRQKLNQHAA